MSLLDTQKAIVKNYVDSLKLADVVYGKVVSNDPMTIKLDAYTDILPSKFIVCPEHLLKHDVEMTCDGIKKTYTVEPQLKGGDRVVLVKALGGQRFYVIGKVK